MNASRLFLRHRGRIVAASLGLGLLGAGAAGAAGVHRLAISTGTGSEGAAATVQTSASGSAIQGEVASSANTSLKLPFGVLGEYDYPGSTFGVGVAGVSTTGYAVGAESFDANPTMIALNESTGDGLDTYAKGTGGDGYGITAEAAGSGDGIDGYADSAGWGGYFYSASGIGVEGLSTGSNSNSSAAVSGVADGSSPGGYFYSEQGNALHAATAASGGAGILGDSSIGSRGILGDNTGEAVVGFGHSGNGHAAIAGLDAVGGTDLLALYAYDSGNLSKSMFVQAGTANRSGDAVETFSTDAQMSGDLYVYGRVYQDCEIFPATSSTDCEPVTSGTETTGAATTRTSDGTTLTTYDARESQPSVADEGTAHLVNGKAYVAIDPAFARTMSMERPYKVFVTPSGDSRGVFVKNRTPRGFEVDENAGGRSTLDFDYRIVAAPFGDRSARLAVVPKKRATRAPLDPALAGLRAQAAAVRAFDRSKLVSQQHALQARHLKHGSPASFVSLMKNARPR